MVLNDVKLPKSREAQKVLTAQNLNNFMLTFSKGENHKHSPVAKNELLPAKKVLTKKPASIRQHSLLQAKSVQQLPGVQNNHRNDPYAEL